MSDLRDIAQILSVISEAFPNFKQTSMTPEVYYQFLNDIPADELRAAVLSCICESGRAFAPSIGEIRGAAAELRKIISDVPSSYQAWQEVLTQMRDNGGDYGCPVWSHPLVEMVVRQLGWRNLRMSEVQTADRARFVQAYEQLLARAEREEMLLPEARGYLEARGGLLLAPSDQMRQLADRLGVRKPYAAEHIARLSLDEDDRRAALETGEAQEIERQYMQEVSQKGSRS